MFLPLLFLASAIAFAISTVSGGGAGLVLLPVLGLGLAAAQVPVALSVGSAISSVARLGLFMRSIEWRIVRWFVPMSLPGAFLGVELLRHMSALYLEVALGLFLLGNLPMLFRRKAVEAPGEPGGPMALMLLGLVAGFVSGLTGAVGLLFNRFYLRYGLTKDEVVATRAANEVLLHMTKLALYAVFGLFSTQALGAGAIVGVASIAGAIAARRLLPYLSESAFRRVGYAAMVAAGAFMTINASAALAGEHGIEVASRRVARGVDVSLKGLGGSVSLELRSNELPEIEYSMPFERLPDDKRAMAERLVEGAERVTVEAVLSWGRRAYELHVHREGEVSKYRL
jgi:uncharacterized membrane protein YfcA